MEKIRVSRFKTYRTHRWFRSDYLWQHQINSYLSKYNIEVFDGESPAEQADVVAIPAVHPPGEESFAHLDASLWISRGHQGLFDYYERPMICDSSMDYAFMDPPLRHLLSYPNIRAIMPNVTFRDPLPQCREEWGGEYYGKVYKIRETYNRGPEVRQDREPMSPEIYNKIVQPLCRPPTPPFSNEVFEHIERRIKPLKDRSIDAFFSGRTRYYPVSTETHPTSHRTRLEELWPKLPGNNVWMSYTNGEGTRNYGKPCKVFNYPYEYVDALLDTKVVISPWGWSPWCVRDIEALACGCIVVKPECSNLVIYPDIYDASAQLMVWCDLMFDHLSDQLNYIYTHLDEMQDRADRGRQTVLDTQYPNEKIHSGWTKVLRRVLENAMDGVACTTARNIVDFPREYLKDVR